MKDLLPEYHRPISLAEAETALTERRAATRKCAAQAETSPGTPQYGPMLMAFAAAELQAEFDVLSEAMAEFTRNTERRAEASDRRNVELREISERAAAATERAAAATERAAKAQEKTTTQTFHTVIVGAIIVFLTVVGEVIAIVGLRQSPPVVHSNPTIVVRPSPAPTVNVLPAPVIIPPTPSKTPGSPMAARRPRGPR